MTVKNKDLQLESGGYTKIVNKIIDDLVKASLGGTELALCLHILRQTYGYHKTEDEISLSQFEEALNKSRPTVCKALKYLQHVNVITLVRGGTSRKTSNLWKFNKYSDTWKMEEKLPQRTIPTSSPVLTSKDDELVAPSLPVKPPELVKNLMRTSKESDKKLVAPSLHTKEIINITKLKRKEKEEEKETPAQEAKRFFSSSQEEVDVFVENLSLQYNWPRGPTKVEVVKFISYWTELNKNGSKCRWESENHFEVRRRLVTWFSRIKGDFKSSGNKYQIGKA